MGIGNSGNPGNYIGNFGKFAVSTTKLSGRLTKAPFDKANGMATKKMQFKRVVGAFQESTEYF